MRNWQLLQHQANQQLPLQIQPWLADRYSLTRRLRRYCGSRFRVEVQHQQQRLASLAEQSLLGIATGQELIERRVFLLNADQPLVFALSLIPLAAADGRFAELARMGERPLGEQLFNDPAIKRGLIEWICIGADTAEFNYAVQKLAPPPKSIYGRRSLFYGAPAQLMVSEFFLPAIPEFALCEPANQ